MEKERTRYIRSQSGFIRTRRSHSPKFLRKIPWFYDSVSHKPESCRIKIGEKELGINVAWAQTEAIPPLLGREDIFDEFEISFRQKQKEIIFQ